MTNTDPADHAAHSGPVARYECTDCGHVGPAADLQLHAAQDRCRNFRTTTTRLSPNGSFLDERVDVCQLPEARA